MKQRVGFVGIGNMGAPTARNLIDAGFEVRVFNRTRAKAEKVAGDAAKDANVVVSMLADDRAAEDAVSEGVARGRGDLDWTGLALEVSEDAGLPGSGNA